MTCTSCTISYPCSQHSEKTLLDVSYHRIVMRGDVARIQVCPFSQNACNPKNRAEAIELVNTWNRRVAEEAIREGLSHTEIFYFLLPEVTKPRPCNARLFGYERTSGGTPVPVVCTRLFGHEGKHSDQRDGNPMEWNSSGPAKLVEGIRAKR